MCECKISPSEFWKTFRGKVIEIENTDRWLIVNFCKNQYPKGLTSEKPAIVSARAILLKLNILLIVEQSYHNHYPMIKDKDMDMDEDKDEVTVKETGIAIAREKKQTTRPTIEEVTAYFAELNQPYESAKFFDYYQSNGWKVGKNAMKDWRATARNWARRNSNGSDNPLDPNRKLTRNMAVSDVNATRDAMAAFLGEKPNNQNQ